MINLSYFEIKKSVIDDLIILKNAVV